jgi:hypothetical protein
MKLFVLVTLLAFATASSSSVALAGSAAMPRIFNGNAYTCIPDGSAFVCTPVVQPFTAADGPLSSGVPLVLDHGGDDLVPISSSKGTTYLILCIICVIMGGLMSGLTVGFMSLDPLKMDVMSQVPCLCSSHFS